MYNNAKRRGRFKEIISSVDVSIVHELVSGGHPDNIAKRRLMHRRARCLNCMLATFFLDCMVATFKLGPIELFVRTCCQQLLSGSCSG